MSTDMDRLVGTLLHGWWELFVLLLALLFAALLLGWAGNRGRRPAERSPLLPAIPFIAAYALLLIVRYVKDDLLQAAIIAVSVTVAAIIVAKSGSRAQVLPIMLLAVLLGFGLNLSSLALLIAAVLILSLSRAGSK